MRLLRLSALLALVPLAAGAAVAAPGRVDASPAAECSQTSIGLTALTDLGKRRYRGHPGGLYPGGANVPSRRYLNQGLAAAKRVRPLSGRIVVLSIGASHVTQEFRAFMRLTQGDPQVSPAVKLVDGAIAGYDARRAARPSSAYWPGVDRRITSAGASPREVQVVWLKQAIAGEDRRFPQDAKALKAQLRAIVQILPRRFPNLRLIYVSNRTYGGYAISSLNPEPAAYHSSFAVRWLIQDRIAGRIRGPWIGWGPYLWTDGERGRLDGFVWTCDDVRKDGTHPSPAGAAKVARLLLNHFENDPTAKSWFSGSG